MYPRFPDEDTIRCGHFTLTWQENRESRSFEHTDLWMCATWRALAQALRSTMR